jgi:type I restriction enzyme S subunit
MRSLRDFLIPLPPLEEQKRIVAKVDELMQLCDELDPEIHQRMNGTSVEAGDVLLNITGASIGRSSIVPDDLGETNVSQHVAIVRLIDKSLRFFIHLCLISPHIQASIMQMQVGISREGLSMRSLRDFLIPLPPLEEQKRIVAKVDELMQLCDELEREQAERRAVRSHLNRAALGQLLAARDAVEFQARWHTVSDHFLTLTATPDLLGKLLQTILQLAVQGKLTRQDPQDESATSLLHRIRAEKERLVKEKRLKPADLLPPVNSDETLFDLPGGWMWARFGNITINRDGERVPIEKSIREHRRGKYDYYGASGVIDKFNDYIFDKSMVRTELSGYRCIIPEILKLRMIYNRSLV